MDPATYQSISAASQMDELGTTSPQPPGQVQQNQNSPTPHQQLNQSPMLLPPHQNSVSWQQHKQAPLTQPSDPALQRLSGLNRRTSLQPQQSQLRLNLQNSNYNDNNSLARISSDSPDKPIFKNIWGFNENNNNSNTNNDKELLNNMSNERNNSNNSLNSSLTSLTFNSPNNPILNNLSTRTHRMSSINEGPTGIANNSIASPNMHTSFNLLNMSTNDSSHVVPSQQTPSMYNSGLSNFNPMRSKSFAISKSKFSMNLPTTYESDNYQQHQQHQQQQQQFHQQQPIQMQMQNQQSLQFSQIPGQKLPSQPQNPQSFQYSQQMQHQPLQLQQQQQQQLQNQGQQLYRRLSHQIDSSFNYQNPNMRQQLLESQQQQVIPPLRAEGPLLSSYNNQSNAFNQPRRESVAAVYHHQQQAQQFSPDHYQRNMSDVSMLSDEDARYLRMQSQIHSEMATHAHDNFQDHNMQGYPDNSLHSHYSINTNEINNDMGAPADNLHEANRVMHRPQSIPVLKPALDLQRLKNKRAPKFSKVSSLNDLHPKTNKEPKYRRFSNNQEFISPLDSLTKDLCLSYSMCSSEFDYQKTKNPKRILTKNNKPVHNNGYDNENYDYILHVNDILGTEENKKYLVLDILGQGTFGQVVKCQNLKTKELVAVKVVKARQECLQQSIAEGNILEYLNKTVDAKSQKYFIQFKDKFMHKYHLCLVFELLRSNLYELIKQNQHHGLDIDLVRTFSIQILKGLCVLKDIKIIHCDLKPENILLRSLNKPDLKIIDFGSSCEEHQAVYTYVQSRFYRSPEVILGVQYSTSVDMWSFGCIVAELFLGLPLFPGATEFEQLVRIIQTFGMPPAWMMVERKASEYIVKTIANNNLNANGPKYNYRLKSLDEFNAEFHTNGQPPKKYFSDTDIDQIIMKYRLPRKQMSQDAIDEEMHKRSCLIHFLKGVLNISPLNRWTPHEAIHHPFITGEKWTGNWNPPTANYGSYTGDSNNTDHFNSQKNIPSSSQKMTRSSSLV